MEEDLIEVGEWHKRKVTQKDADLYKDIMQFLDSNTKNGACWHYGREDIGNLTTYLLEKYKIDKL